MNAFEDAIERGEIELGEYAEPFGSAVELAWWFWEEENAGETFDRARAWARSASAGGLVAVSTLYRVANAPEVRRACDDAPYLERLHFADSILTCMGFLLQTDETDDEGLS